MNKQVFQIYFMNLPGVGVSLSYQRFLSDVPVVSGLSRLVHKQTLGLGCLSGRRQGSNPPGERAASSRAARKGQGLFFSAFLAAQLRGVCLCLQGKSTLLVYVLALVSDSD